MFFFIYIATKLAFFKLILSKHAPFVVTDKHVVPVKHSAIEFLTHFGVRMKTIHLNYPFGWRICHLKTNQLVGSTCWFVYTHTLLVFLCSSSCSSVSGNVESFNKYFPSWKRTMAKHQNMLTHR